MIYPHASMMAASLGMALFFDVAAIFAATGAPLVGQGDGQDHATVGQMLAKVQPKCTKDGVIRSGGRATGAAFYGQMKGFAQSAGTDGGLGRRVFTVTQTGDPQGKALAGSLRWAVAQANAAGGGWIAFAPALRDAKIRLKAPLRLGSHMTIDGGCAMPRLIGEGPGSILYLRGSRNIVITRLYLEQVGGGGNGDCITVSHGADRVWLAYLRLRQCRDGLIDVTRDGVAGPMRVTVSHNRFSDHDKAMLIVGAPLAGACANLRQPIQLTVAGNIFYRTGQRHPRASGDAFVHLQNNVIAFEPQQRARGRLGGAYGTLAADGAQVMIENTLYIPPADSRKYRLVADSAGAPAEASRGATKLCQHGRIEMKSGQMALTSAARQNFIRRVIAGTNFSL